MERGVRMRACIGCGRISPTPRCTACAVARPYSTTQYKLARAQTLNEEGTCWMCLQPGTAADPLTADHLVPVVDGGVSIRANLRAAHRSCNSRRGATRTSF